jgi:molybdopterin-binding protein
LSNESNGPTQILHHEVGSLFSRLNFFLVATAFLIAVLVTAAFDGHKSWPFVFLLHAIAAAGFLVSLLFMLTNYLNARLIKAIREKLENDESLNYKELRYIMRERWSLSSLGKDFIDFVKNPVKHSRDNPASHAWVLPLGFVFFWLLVWFIVVPFRFTQGLQTLVPAIVVLVVCYYLWHVHAFSTQERPGARNELRGIVKSVEPGEVMDKIVSAVDMEVVSLISHKSAKRMELKPGDKITAVIEASEVMIVKGWRDSVNFPS